MDRGMRVPHQAIWEAIVKVCGPEVALSQTIYLAIKPHLGEDTPIKVMRCVQCMKEVTDEQGAAICESCAKTQPQFQPDRMQDRTQAYIEGWHAAMEKVKNLAAVAHMQRPMVIDCKANKKCPVEGLRSKAKDSDGS